MAAGISVDPDLRVSCGAERVQLDSVAAFKVAADLLRAATYAAMREGADAALDAVAERDGKAGHGR